LAARAEGVGVGWVSIFDPEAARATLDLPPDWSFVAYLCLGWPEEEHDDPELERHGWEQRSCEASVTPLKRETRAVCRLRKPALRTGHCHCEPPARQALPPPRRDRPG